MDFGIGYFTLKRKPPSEEKIIIFWVWNGFLQCNKMADSTTNEPVCAQVCVLKKIRETNVNVKERRVGASRLRAIDSSCMRVNRRPVL